MNSAIERLLSLRVSDVMNTAVVTIHENETMAIAASRFSELNISGAPVVDDCGRCVGILTVTDFALREARHRSPAAAEPGGFHMNVILGTDSSPLRLEASAENRVGEHMTASVQTVSAKATLIDAGRLMCHEHIHRLVIVDDDSRPIGMVTSLDLVAATIAAVEE